MWLLEIITVLLIISCSLFIHEMGHAVAAVTASKNSKVEVFLGTSSKTNKLRLRIGRITCYLTIALSGFCNYRIANEFPSFTYKQKIFFFMGGPIASLLISTVLFIVSFSVSGVAGNILINSAAANFFLFITSMIPWTYPAFLGGLPSDGLQVLNLMKTNRKDRTVRTEVKDAFYANKE